MKAGLLLLNAAAILHKERFLDKLGWTEQATIAAQSMMSDPYFPGAPNSMYGQTSQPSSTESMKTQFLKFVIAVQTIMRVPLIFINLFAIALELLLG